MNLIPRQWPGLILMFTGLFIVLFAAPSKDVSETTLFILAFSLIAIGAVLATFAPKDR